MKKKKPLLTEVFKINESEGNWKEVKYSGLPQKAKAAWDKAWNDLDPNDYGISPDFEQHGDDPSTSWMGEEDEGRKYFTNGLQAACWQPGHILRSPDYCYWFDGSKWYDNQQGSQDNMEPGEHDVDEKVISAAKAAGFDITAI